MADDSLGDLLARNARTLRRLWAAAAAPFDLSPHQVRALRVIHEAPVRPGALADRLRIAPRSATDVVDGLLSAGLVQRHSDPADRRAVILTITDLGHTTLTGVLAERDSAARAWLHTLSKADREALLRILRQLDDARPQT